MFNGFDLNDPLVCEGIIGDGCGGGRVFFIKDETLYAHDPISKKSMTLAQNIKKAKNISKSKCIITIECEDKKIELDLSKITPP
ncbi:thiamine biosynthesis protein ThiF [Sulfurimonas sp.]|jgi:hypothetical protein|uniref:thiamine biosynthesis protein ThiF n=1 Tax=Sulfurimonas sp. TaxID=2022749 RepID=UPI0025E06493|nr:thiamine biosynthesis protein ThiF [Sulfurimonas sp.]MCK9473128.1 thiamine biosynthesis protein ThiF [Sulfurimonas sp.]